VAALVRGAAVRAVGLLRVRPEVDVWTALGLPRQEAAQRSHCPRHTGRALPWAEPRPVGAVPARSPSRWGQRLGLRLRDRPGPRALSRVNRPGSTGGHRTTDTRPMTARPLPGLLGLNVAAARWFRDGTRVERRGAPTTTGR
jgi:hypothetical protein